MKRCIAFVLAAAALAPAAHAQLPEKTVIRVDREAAAAQPWSPAVLVGNTLYVAGQSGLDGAGQRPAALDDEARAAFASLRRVLGAAGMDYGNVVSLYTFVAGAPEAEAAGRIARELFGARPPASSVIGAGRMPGGARVVVQAVAVQDGAARVHIASPSGWKSGPPTAAVKVNGLVYLSGFGAADMRTGQAAASPRVQIKQSLANLGEALQAAGVDYRHVIFVNPFMAPGARGDLDVVYRQFFEYGNTPARGTLEMAWVPNGHPIELSAVAVAELERRRVIRPISRELSATASPAVMGGGALYLSGFSGFMPGYGVLVEDFDVQLRFAMRNILDCLETAGMTFDNVVALNGYLGNLDDSEKTLRLFREYFPRNPPALTLLQQSPSGPKNRPIVQFTGIAVRSVTAR